MRARLLNRKTVLEPKVSSRTCLLGLLCDEYIDSGDGEKGGALDNEALH